jgi:glycosyltransferase involved in cell wall biosynthesis
MEKIFVMNEVKDPKVSVVIPTLNEEKYIEPTLRALRSQNYKEKYEVIVVDSNSKDRTVEIAKKFADKVIVTERKGVSVGRNLGAKHAKGEILFFVDADTILLPNVILTVVKKFNQKSVVGVSVPLIGDDLKKNVLYFFGAAIYNLLTKIELQPIYAVCFACRKEAFWKAGGFDENLKVAEDVELGSQLKKLGKILYVTDTFVVTSTRRLKKWNIVKQLKAWPLGYLSIKLFNKQPRYPPVR